MVNRAELSACYTLQSNAPSDNPPAAAAYYRAALRHEDNPRVALAAVYLLQQLSQTHPGEAGSTAFEIRNPAAAQAWGLAGVSGSEIEHLRVCPPEILLASRNLTWMQRALQQEPIPALCTLAVFFANSGESGQKRIAKLAAWCHARRIPEGIPGLLRAYRCGASGFGFVSMLPKLAEMRRTDLYRLLSPAQTGLSPVLRSTDFTYLEHFVRERVRRAGYAAELEFLLEACEPVLTVSTLLEKQTSFLLFLCRTMESCRLPLPLQRVTYFAVRLLLADPRPDNPLWNLLRQIALDGEEMAEGFRQAADSLGAADVRVLAKLVRFCWELPEVVYPRIWEALLAGIQQNVFAQSGYTQSALLQAALGTMSELDADTTSQILNTILSKASRTAVWYTLRCLFQLGGKAAAIVPEEFCLEIAASPRRHPGDLVAWAQQLLDLNASETYSLLKDVYRQIS